MKFIFQMILINILFLQGIDGAKLLFLPVEPRGEIPEKLKNTPNLPMELAQMQSWLAKETYYTETSTRAEIEKLISFMGKIQKKPLLGDFKKYCNQTDSDYIIYTEILFGKKIIFSSEIMNCGNRKISTIEQVFGNNLYTAVKKNLAKNFYFLPKRQKDRTLSGGKSSLKTIYLLDDSVSFYNEINHFKNFVKRWPTSGNGVLILKKNVYKYFSSKSAPEMIVAYLNANRPKGDLTLQDIGNGVLKILELQENGKFNVVILTDAKPASGDDIRFPNIMRTLRNKADDVKLVTGSFFDNQTLNLYKKSARAGGNELVQLTHRQKVGTKDGYKYLYLNNMDLYFTSRGSISSDAPNFEKMTKIAPGEIYSRTSSLRPEMMAGMFEKIFGESLLEKDTIESDLETLLEKIADSGMDSSRELTNRVLLKVNGTAIWINFNIPESEKGQDIVIRTRMVSDSKSSYGFTNVVKETALVKGDFPLLLLMTPSEISSEIRKKGNLECLLKGTILDVR